MRTTTGPEDAVLSAPTYQPNWRVKIANGSGTMKDWSSWVEDVLYDEQIDTQVSQMDLQIRRDFGSTLSLSPLRTDSTLNVLDDNVTFSPAIDVGRAITVELATTPVHTAPVAGDWKLVFAGNTDDLDFDTSPMHLVSRDSGGKIVDAFVETEVVEPAVASLEVGIQRLLDVRFGAGVIPLFTPTPSGYALNAYKQQVQSVAAAIDALEQLNGWDTRYRWDNTSSTFKYTLSDPGRAKVIPDYTFGPSRILSVTKLGFQRKSVRNVIVVSYKDIATGVRTSFTASDATSISRYDRQVLLITEDDLSPINTLAQATTMANFILADLKDPKAEQEIDMFLWWPAQLNDLYRFSANGRHYNTDQDWAVVGIKHHIALGQHRTTLTVRGKPTGGYDTWINRSDPRGASGIPNPKLQAYIQGGGAAADGSEDLTFSADGGDAPLTWRTRAINSRTGVGAWSAWNPNSGGFALPYTYTQVRGPRWNYTVEFQYQDGTGRFSNIASYVTGGQIDSLDSTTGRVARGIPSNDGNYSLAASDTAGMTAHANVKESGLKFVNRLYAKPLSSSPDTADSVGNGVSQRAIPFSVLRASDGFLLSGASDGATIGSVSAGRVARSMHGLFLDTFEGSVLAWTKYAGNAATTAVITPAVGVVGSQAMHIAYDGWFIADSIYPYDATKLHRITTAAKLVAGSAGAGKDGYYCGVACYDVNMVSLGICWIASFNTTLVTGAYQPFAGFFKGTSAGGSSNSPDAAAPGTLLTGTVYIRPIVIGNYTASTGDTYIDYVSIMAMDEDASDRTYTTIGTGQTLKSAAKESGGKAVNRLFGKPLSSDPDTLDSTPDGTSYGKPLLTRLSAGKPLIDFGETIHVNKTQDYIADSASRFASPVPNATSDVVLVASSGVTLGGNNATKTGGAAGWGTDQVYSKDGYTGGAFASVVAIAPSGQDAMFGLNTDPTTDANWTSLDYALQITSGTIWSYENGVYTGLTWPCAAGDVLTITYDGSNVRYLQNGTVLRTVAVAAGIKFFFDSAFNAVGSQLNNIRFGPMSSNDASSVGAGVLTGGITQSNGASPKNIASGRYSIGTGVHAATISFPSNYQNPPAVNILGGISYEPASVWGTAAQADAGGGGTLATAAARQIDEVVAYNVTTSGATLRARLRQASASTARSNAFPSTALGDGGTAVVTVASAPANNDTYTASYTAEATSTTPPGKTCSVSMTISLQYYNGSSWITVASATYSASDPVGGAADTGLISATLVATVSGLISTSQMRLLVTSNSGAGSRTYVCNPGNLTYTTTAGDQYVTKTPAGLGINLSVEVVGAS